MRLMVKRSLKTKCEVYLDPEKLRAYFNHENDTISYLLEKHCLSIRNRWGKGKTGGSSWQVLQGPVAGTDRMQLGSDPEQQETEQDLELADSHENGSCFQ